MIATGFEVFTSAMETTAHSGVEVARLVKSVGMVVPTTQFWKTAERLNGMRTELVEIATTYGVWPMAKSSDRME